MSDANTATEVSVRADDEDCSTSSGHGQLVRKLEHDFVSARSFWALAQSRGRGTSHDHQTGFTSTMSLEEVDAAGCSAILDGGLERAPPHRCWT